MIRVVLPTHLRTLAHADREVQLDVDGRPTQRAVVDAIELAYPMLRGTLRDPATQRRRAMIRFFACEQDLPTTSPTRPCPTPSRRAPRPC